MGGSRHDPARFPRAGEVTNNGIGKNRYSILTGASSPEKWRLLPNYGAHSARVPVHTLEGNAARHALLSDEESFYRPPTSRTAGVTHGVDSGREYTLANSAFQPAGFRSPVRRETVPEKAVEYRSFRALKQDKTKHVRAVHEPLTRAAAPMLSSQSYGWEAKLWESRRRENLAGGRGGVGETARRPRVGCRETIFAQSILVGSRHVHGYSGQGFQKN